MSHIRVAILDDYQNVALSMGDWSAVQAKASIDIYRDTILDEDELAKRLEPYTVICTMRERTRITASLLDKLPNLKYITTTALVNRSIDVEAATKKGIIVTGAPGHKNPTVEHIWALIFAVARQIAVEDKNIREGNPQWQSIIPFGLGKKTISLLGVGRLGKEVAQIANLFGMRVLAWSPHLTKERAEAAGAELAASKEDLFKQADILSIHMVLAPSTRHLVGKADLALLKPTSLFINTSRGPLVDEEALLDMMYNKRIAGVGLDVYDIEPLPLDHPIRKAPISVLSPHNAYVTDDNYKAWYSQTAENVGNFLEGRPLHTVMGGA